MNHNCDQPTTPEEESLFAFADHPQVQPGNDLEATAGRVYRAIRRDTVGAAALSNDIKHHIWEDIMSSATVDPGHAHSGQNLGIPESNRLPMPARPWSVATNILLAAAVILALSVGIWRASGGMNFGNNDPQPPTVPFSGLAAEDATPTSIDPADLPTAEDCTVEPLTVDEVLWYVKDPYEANYSADIASPGPMPTESFSATPPATNPPNYESGNATQEELEAAAQTQFMLTACVMADSYFQVWALLSPWEVREDVIASIPTLTGEDEARAILEDLEANGPVSDSEMIDEMTGRVTSKFYSMENAARYAPARSQGIWMLDTTPENSWKNSENTLAAGFVTYNADGTANYPATSIFANRGGTPVAQESDGLIQYFGCSFQFEWNEARSMWLVSSGPTCMG